MIVRIEQNIPLAPLTSFKIGGVADYFCRVRNEDELHEALAFAREKSLPVFILGGGTNILVPDAGFRGVAVKMEMRGITLQNPPPTPSFIKEGERGGGFLLVASSGEPWDALVSYAVEQGWWCIENLSGIPGTVGGAPVQNIGAYGVELKEVLEWVDTIDMHTGAAQRFSCAECQFGYRDSFFKTAEGKNFIIMRVALRLQKDGTPNLSYKDLAEYFKTSHHPASPTRHPSLPRRQAGSSKEGRGTPTLSEMRRAVLEIRARKFPDLEHIGTAGSFFKNPIISCTQYEKLKERYPDLPGFSDTECFSPIGSDACVGAPNTRCRESYVKVSLAWILDKVCNLKGFGRGNAALWENQPLVLVNRGGARAAEVRALAEEVAEKVRAETGIALEWEVQDLPDGSQKCSNM